MFGHRLAIREDWTISLHHRVGVEESYIMAHAAKYSPNYKAFGPGSLQSKRKHKVGDSQRRYDQEPTDKPTEHFLAESGPLLPDAVCRLYCANLGHTNQCKSCKGTAYVSRQTVYTVMLRYDKGEKYREMVGGQRRLVGNLRR